MFTTNTPPNRSFHYVSASSLNPQYLLLIDTTKMLEKIFSYRNLLLNSAFTTTRGEYIRPRECDQATDISNEIRDLTSKLPGKLRAIDDLHAMPKSNYRKLVMYLYSANDRFCNLADLLNQFRPISMQNTGQQRSIFIKIQKEIVDCVRACEQIEAETEKLLDLMLLTSN